MRPETLQMMDRSYSLSGSFTETRGIAKDSRLIDELTKDDIPYPGRASPPMFKVSNPYKS